MKYLISQLCYCIESLIISTSKFAFRYTICLDHTNCYYTRHYFAYYYNIRLGAQSTFVQAVFIQTVAVYMCHLLFESFFHKKKKYRSKSNDFLMHISCCVLFVILCGVNIECFDCHHNSCIIILTDICNRLTVDDTNFCVDMYRHITNIL